MSINKHLEHELANNPQADQERIQDLEAQRKLQREILQKEHTKIATGVIGKTDDISLNYMQRDSAFFDILHSTQHLQSKITVLSNYQQALPMPNILDLDVRIASVLQLRDPNETAYLLDFKTFVEDQAAHEREIERLNRWIQVAHERIQDIVIPQILYMLLVWAPILIQLYRYFYSVNPLDEAIRQGQSLQAEIEGLKKQVQLENERFYGRWQTKYSEYYALSMNLHKATKMLQEYTHVEKLEQNQQALEAFIQSCDRPALQAAYGQFQAQPCYLYLFHLCTCLCEYQYSLLADKKNASQCKKALMTLGELYPKINTPLVKFTEETMQHISKANVFKILERQLEKNYAASKRIEEKRKQNKSEMGKISLIGSRLHPTDGAVELGKANIRLQELDASIETANEQLRKRREFIEPLKHFIQNKTGESLRELYWFVSNTEGPAYQQYATILRSLYPASLESLEAEQQETLLTVNSETAFRLQELYLSKILAIERSRDSRVSPFKEVARALKPLLGTMSWRWEHFFALEHAIKKNPRYQEDPNLAALVNQITSTVANSRKFEASREERKPIKSAKQSPELVVNPNNPLPTFFQPPSRNESAVSPIIRDLVSHIRHYNIRYSDEPLSNEAKQENIQSVGHQMLQYIGLLSDADAMQTISPDHLALLRHISDFIRQVSAQDSQNQLTISDLGHIKAMLKQLDSKHPIREGTEFLISVFQTKEEYIAINTQFAQMRLQQDLAEDIRSQNSYEERQQKRRNSQLSPEKVIDMNKWQISNSCLRLLTDYVAKLNRFASPSNEEERQLLNPLSELATQIHHILRNNSKRNHEIPQMMQQFEQQCDRLREHPACAVARRMEDALKDTEAYAKVLLPTGAKIDGPKKK